MQSVWETLSNIDCSEFIERKGNLSYLSWSHAYQILMKHYPNAQYEMLPEERMPDETVMTSCRVTIADQTREMWLPVMDHRNNAIANPDARKISDTRMRCFTKCLAMFGLGAYIYQGEDVPREPDPVDAHKQACAENMDSIRAIRDGIANDDLSSASEAWFELTDAAKKALWLAPTKGGWFTTKEREVIKSKEFREANGSEKW
jgi:hypothetical protein